MKDNVDLTENRVFSSPIELRRNFLDFVIVDAKPWEFDKKVIKEYSIFSYSPSIFAVGNKKDRQNAKQEYAYFTNQICEICGQSRGRKPWAKDRCICYSMLRACYRIPWRW